MTREEYLQEQVEDFINNGIIPVLKKKKLGDLEIEAVNRNAFLYQVGRLHPFQIIMWFSRFIDADEYDEIMAEYFGKMNKGYLWTDKKEKSEE